MVELMMDMLDFCCLLWPGCGVWRPDFHVAGWERCLPRGKFGGRFFFHVALKGGKERNGGKIFSTSGANYLCLE